MYSNSFLHSPIVEMGKDTPVADPKISRAVLSNEHIRAQKLILIGHITMLASAIGIFLTIIVAYTHYQYFSLVTQIVAHIAMLMFAGSLKLGYVVKLTGARLQFKNEGEV